MFSSAGVKVTTVLPLPVVCVGLVPIVPIW